MDISIRMFSLHQPIYWLLIDSVDDFNFMRPHFSILINYWPTCCGSCQQMFYRGEMLSVWQHANFFWKLRHQAKLRSQPASFPIFSGKILKMQEKGPAATNWLKMRVIPQKGVGGLIRPERQMHIWNGFYTSKISLLSPLIIGWHSSAAPAADCQLFSHVQSHLNYYIYII